MSNIATLQFDEITLGEKASFEVVVDVEKVEQFAALSGDVNPLHMDEAYAKTTELGGRIAHGFVGASFLSKLIGMYLPGKHALYLSQTLSFRKPIRIGSIVVVSGEVIQKVEALRVIKVATRIKDRESGECLIDGEAMVKVLQ
jgi:3-hydroxybutyryl-CoA dehydratase